jgi:UDP-glucose 4-epimerase
MALVCLRYFNASGADLSGEVGEDHEPEPHLIPRALLAVQGDIMSIGPTARAGKGASV